MKSKNSSISDKPHSCILSKTIKLSARQLSVLKLKAKEAELPLGSYIRTAAIKATVATIVLPAINQDQWLQLARLASNVNQISKAVNSTGWHEDFRVSEVLEQTRDHLKCVRATLLGFDKKEGDNDS